MSCAVHPDRRSVLAGSLFIAAAAVLAAAGCGPVKRFAINQVANTLAEGGQAFLSDDDPQLVREALPFSLKLMESTLAETPRHRPLLLAACKGFAQYAYGYLKQDADEMEERDLAASQSLRQRAKKLLWRGRSYGMRALEIAYPGIESGVRENAQAALARVRRQDVGLLYWTAVAWGGAISLAKDDPELVADQSLAIALLDRALALDETYDAGAIHAALISVEMVRREAGGKAEERAKAHFERALALSGGRLASPLVAYAEDVCVPRQDRRQFAELLQRALAIDPDAKPEWRMVNLIMQRRARWLLSKADELFAE